MYNMEQLTNMRTKMNNAREKGKMDNVQEWHQVKKLNHWICHRNWSGPFHAQLSYFYLSPFCFYVFYLLRVKQASLPTSILTTFYKKTCQNMFSLHFNMVVKLQGGEQKRPHRGLGGWWKKIIHLLNVTDQDMFQSHCRNRALNIVWDTSHLLHGLLQLLPSGKRYHSTRCKTTRLLNSCSISNLVCDSTTALFDSPAAPYAVLYVFWEFVLYSIYNIYYRLLFMMDVFLSSDPICF